MTEFYWLIVFRKGNHEFPLLELHPETLEQLLKWEKDVRACYFEEEYVIKSMQSNYKRGVVYDWNKNRNT